MDVRLHPDYAKNGWIYLSVADPGENRAVALTKIVRGKLAFEGNDAKWTSQETIYESDKKNYSNAGIHFGGKIAFDGKGHVFFSVGERGTNMRAQDPATPYGKVMRLNEDGSMPKDNPFPNNPAWTFGHRNPQGLAFDSEGKLWDTEHGPRGGDEFNLIEKGNNYGWPVVSFGINYSGAAFKQPWPELAGQDAIARNIVMPLDRWLPSIGACGLDVVRSDKFADWKGDMLAGGLSGNNVDRIRVAPATDMPADAPADLRLTVIEREEIVHGLGRVRDVVSAPDGFIYIVLNDPDKVVRLVPVPR
jgi:glucose/arabinose dehydrogenase